MSTIKHLVIILFAGAMCGAACAEPEASSKVRLRAVLHDPMKPFVEMYVTGPSGALERLNLAMEGLTEAQTVTLPKGVLLLYSSATVDATKPLANLLASVVVPETVKQAIVFILPSNEPEKLPYKLMVLNDSTAAFPRGESRVINMTRMPLAVRAGEHALEIAPGKLVAVPRVTKLNALNQAQTSFYRKTDTEWLLLAERPMQYTPTLRNIFLVYLMPNVEEPQIRTLVDTSAPTSITPAAGTATKPPVPVAARPH
ncbi:MAG: hypothetical protein WCK77_00295 [Verrucomicrobiota bacterium]